jgi:hypothetical protein
MRRDVQIAVRFGMRGHVRAFGSGPAAAGSPHSKFEVALIFQSANNIKHEVAPHGPMHWLFESGVYIVTAGTYQEFRHLSSAGRLDFFFLFGIVVRPRRRVRLEFTRPAVLPNHYHFVATSSQPNTLGRFLGRLHMQTARQLNL